MSRFISKTIPLIFMGAALFFFIFVQAHQAQAADVTLSWAKPDDSRVTGYQIFCGTTKPLPMIGQVDSADTLSYAISGLLPSTEYQFMAKSKDVEGNVSDPSEYLHYVTASEPVDIIVIKLKAPGTLKVEAQ